MQIRALMAGTAVLALAACGGGGSGGSQGAAPPTSATPTPPASPPSAPPPAPSPPPAATLVTTTIAATSTGNTTPARQLGEVGQSSTGSALFEISDPDAPSATSFADINFDGDESFTLKHVFAAGGYVEAVPASSFGGSTDTNVYIDYSNGNAQRAVPVSLWQTRPGGADAFLLALRRLEEVRKTPGSATITRNEPEYVRLFDTRRANDLRGLQLAGQRSTAAQLPTSGTVTYAGETFGTAQDGAGRSGEFVGDVLVTVDYATGQYTVSLGITSWLSGGMPVTSGQLTFSGTLSGAAFQSGALSLSSTTLTGDAAGSLFGPAADEIGFIVQGRNASGLTLLLGAVAGRQ